MRELIDLIQHFIFRFRKIPSWEKAAAKIPDGNMRIYDASNLSLGNLEWKKGWRKEYDEERDPNFRPSIPWDTSLSDPTTIDVKYGMITLTQKAHSKKMSYMQSNFTIKTGTVRALIRCPKIEGAWSAFWLFGEHGMPEHDMMEHCGEWSNQVAVTHHWGYDYENVRGKKSTLWNGRKNKNFKPTEEFYLYEVTLTPYETIYKINGVVVRKMGRAVSSGINRVIFDVTTGKYCGSKELTEDATMEVAWLQVFTIE